MNTRTVKCKAGEYRVGGPGMLLSPDEILMVACLPLFCIGCGAVFAGLTIAEQVRKARQRRRCEKIREQRMAQRIALREARKNECSGERWDSLMRISALKNIIFESTVAQEVNVPTGEEVGRQWDRTHDSLGEMIRFGLMMLEIEATVDSSVIMGEDADGTPVIVGRNPGIRGWLNLHCPHIGYKTAMRYKSLARKALQSRKSETLISKSETLYELQESLYTDLGIPHVRLEKPRAKRKAVHRHRQRRGPCQSLIFATRVRAHDVLRALSMEDARRLSAAFLSLAGEIHGAS